MIVLLVIFSAGFILYGYLLMGRLDRFIENNGFSKEEKNFTQKEILLCGEEEIIDPLSRALDEAAVTYDRESQSEAEDSGSVFYRWVGAFFADDEKNLLICLMAKRKNSAVCTMAKCNDRLFENIFRQTGVTVILQNEIPVNRVLACLKKGKEG